jgi:hypothetical protein
MLRTKKTRTKREAKTKGTRVGSRFTEAQHKILDRNPFDATAEEREIMRTVALQAIAMMGYAIQSQLVGIEERMK